jgi:hypothetical protein
MRLRIVPLLQIDGGIVSLLFFRMTFPRLISLADAGPISLLARIINGRLARVFFVGLFLSAHIDKT